jgi:hypothetical protein
VAIGAADFGPSTGLCPGAAAVFTVSDDFADGAPSMSGFFEAQADRLAANAMHSVDSEAVNAGERPCRKSIRIVGSQLIEQVSQTLYDKAHHLILNIYRDFHAQ